MKTIPRHPPPICACHHPIRDLEFGLSASQIFDMIELIQFPWSPFCIVQRRILEFSGTKFKITNIPNGDALWSGV